MGKNIDAEHRKVRVNRLSITKKISLLVLSIVVVAIAAYAYFAISQFKADKLKYIHLVNSNITNAIGTKIKYKLDGTETDMKNIALLFKTISLRKTASPILKGIFSNNPSIIGLFLFEKFKPNAPYVTSYALLNKDLVNIRGLKLEDLKGIAKMQLDRKIASVTDEKTEFTRVNDEEQNSLIYFFDLGKSKYLTFIVGKEFLNETVETDVSEVAIIDRAGKVLAASKGFSGGEDIANHPIVLFAGENPVEEGGTEFQLRSPSSTDSYIGNFFKLNSNLMLISQVHRERAFAGMKTLTLNTLFFAVALSGIAILIGLVLSRGLTAPLQSLMTVTEDIAAGNYNPALKIKSNDEIGQLADYFVDLGKRLSQRESELEKTTELAIRDGLTGVYNHRHFAVRGEEFFNLSKRSGRKLSVILVDIDFFKKFNDTYGHQQGDQVIRDIAQVLTKSTRDTDFVARYGGEEFVVIAPDTDMEGAKNLAEKIRIAYESHKIKNINDEGYLSSTCSLGVSCLNNGTFENFKALVELADKGLYVAKKSGRNKVGTA